jgi:hypothetical protein
MCLPAFGVKAEVLNTSIHYKGICISYYFDGNRLENIKFIRTECGETLFQA